MGGTTWYFGISPQAPPLPSALASTRLQVAMLTSPPPPGACAWQTVDELTQLKLPRSQWTVNLKSFSVMFVLDR